MLNKRRIPYHRRWCVIKSLSLLLLFKLWANVLMTFVVNAMKSESAWFYTLPLFDTLSMKKKSSMCRFYGLWIKDIL